MELARIESGVALDERILDNLTTAVLMFDAGLRLCFVNPAGEMLLAASARHLFGVGVAELLPNAALVNDIRSAMDTGHPFTEREVVLQLNGTRRLTVDVTVMPLPESTHGPELLVELVQVDRQLRISRDETLLAQQQTTRELLRGLSHEIKNPLGGLRGAAQLLERELGDERLKEYTQVIISEADRLQALVDRMLGPNTVPRRAKINIHELLEHVRSLVLAEAEHGVSVHRDYDPSIPDITADRDQIVQAVLNITRNAAQALGERGNITFRTRVIRQFTIGHTRHRLVACIEIIDNGPGIPPDIRERVFYPLVTGRAEGTGLGLAIAQSLIQQHGGLIECTSRPGRTVFSILLPVENDVA